MIKDSTGRLISLRGSEPKAGPSSSLFQDRATGRLWQVGSAGITKNVEDSFILDYYPNNNYGDWNVLYVQSFKIYPGQSENMRTFIKSIDIANPNKLYLYVAVARKDFEIGVYPVLGDWEELILTWNNKPAIGSMISSKVVGSGDIGTWVEFHLGGYRDVCIKALVEDSPDHILGIAENSIKFYSSENVDESKRPYFT